MSRLFEKVYRESNSDFSQKIKDHLQDYVGHGLSANALNDFDDLEKHILSYALEDEEIFSDAFEAAAAQFENGEMMGGELWELDGFEEVFLGEVLEFGRQNENVMGSVEDDEHDEYIEGQDAKQQQRWKDAGIDDYSLDEMGNIVEDDRDSEGYYDDFEEQEWRSQEDETDSLYDIEDEDEEDEWD